MVEQTPKFMDKHPSIAALQWCWKTYGALSSHAIGQHIREPGGPWDKVWNAEARKGEQPQPVPPALIKNWFNGLTSRREEQAHNSKLTRTQKLELHTTMTGMKLRSS